MDLRKQLQKIIDLLIEKEVSYDALMLNLQVVAHYLKNDDFSFWIMSEMNSYKDEKVLPDYRIIQTVLMGNFMISNMNGAMNYSRQVLLLPKDEKIRNAMSHFRCKESIAKLISYSNKPLEGELQITTDLRYASIIEDQYESDIHIYQMWQHINAADFVSIVNGFKSKVLEFIMNLNDDENLDLDFDKPATQSKITTYVKAAVYADRESNVNVIDSSIKVK